MAIVGSSTSATVASGTSVTFTLAASVGDLLVAFIACDAPRNIIPPSVYTSGVADSWVPLVRQQAQDSDFLNLYVLYKTANAADAATGVFTFNSTFANDPSNAGQNFPTMNIAGALLRFLPTAGGKAGLDVVAPQGYLRGSRSPFQLPLLTGTRPDRFVTATALLGSVNPAYTHSDPSATSIQNPNLSTGTQRLCLNVFFSTATSTTYPFQVSTTNVGSSPAAAVAVVGLSDASTAWLYTAPFVREGIPNPGTRLLERFPYHQGFTVVNNGGIFTATRFYSQDQLAAATQTFTQTSQVTATDRTNILNSNVGGDFRPLT